MNSTVLRVSCGVAILGSMAMIDLLRHGRDATRWREYAFLAICVAAAIGYGIANDQITSRISWEYFYFGKDLASRLGDQTPPDPAALSWQAVRIGAEATWTAGLIIGTALLLANNPSPRFAQLSFGKLALRLPSCFVITILMAILGGIAGYELLLDWMGEDLRGLVRDNLWRPHRFMAVFGIHLGGYVGGVVAIVYNVWRVRRLRATRPI